MRHIPIWAEIGINHQGDLPTAIRLIDAAKESGADLVKFQMRNPEVSTPEHQKSQPRMWQGELMTYLDYKRKVEFGKPEYDAIALHCDEICIPWTASVWDCDSVDFLSRYDVPFAKIPSAHAANETLLNKVKSVGFPIALSTGMTTEGEIHHSLDVLSLSTGLSLLHCHSAYPSPEAEQNLLYIPAMKANFGYPVGYSAHCDSPYPSMFAAALGAEFIEQHITLSRSMEGSDHAASLEPKGMALLRRELDRLPVVSGQAIKVVWPSELPARLKLRGY